MSEKDMSDSVPQTRTMSNANSSEAADVAEKRVKDSANVTNLAKDRPSLLLRIWRSLHITPTVVMFMVKGAVAPTIALSIYQSQAVAVNYLNFGYVMIVISITTVPILPRGQFIMNLIVSVFLTCFAAAMVLLGQYAGIKARDSSKPSGAPADPYGTYNSAAAAVNAIFLMINLFLINMLKAARPAIYIPSIQFSVFVIVGFTYGPNQTTLHSMYNFIRELLYTFLTGQGISAGVALLVIPISSRKVFFAETTGILRAFQGLLKAQLAFLETMAQSGIYGEVSSPEIEAQYQQRSKAVNAVLKGVIALSTKLRADVVFAQREAAYGHFDGADIGQLHQCLRGIVVPISSLSTITDISERLRKHEKTGKENSKSEAVKGADKMAPTSSTEDSQKDVRRNWQELAVSLHESFESIVQLLDDSITHVLMLLQLIPRPKSKTNLSQAEEVCTKKGTAMPDLETGSTSPAPGDLGFGAYLEKEVINLRPYRSLKLQEWAEGNGLASIVDKHAGKSDRDDIKTLSLSSEDQLRRKLNLVLYIEYLIYTIAITILALVQFAEAKVEDGTLKKKRFISPAYSAIALWFKGLFVGGDSANEVTDVQDPDDYEEIRLGDSLKGVHDPEHLPPENAWQAFGNRLRIIPRVLSSRSAHFGFRVTIATMSVGIMAFLEKTHVFFVGQRVVWALVMIAIGMRPTSGSANFLLACNTIFTVGGMVTSYINWYMVDGHTAGVIVFFALFMAFYFYWAARFPRILIGVVAGSLTQVLVIGYELQVRVLGRARATATGITYYPIYELAPFRLLTVLAGSFIAYIWTIFPSPITEGSVLRQNVGRSLFLLAKYLSSVTATVDQRIHNAEGNMMIEISPGRRLKDVRGKQLDEQMALINAMQQNLIDMDWEPPLGGSFPKQTYAAIINEIQHIVQYLTVIAYSSEAFSTAHSNQSFWLAEFASSHDRSSHRSHKMTSLLALLAASIANNQPMPPYLAAPKRVHLSVLRQAKAQGDESSNSILGIKNVGEPGFRTLSVIEVASACAVDGMNELIDLAKELVGELDFSFELGKAKVA